MWCTLWKFQVENGVSSTNNRQSISDIINMATQVVPNTVPLTRRPTSNYPAIDETPLWKSQNQKVRLKHPLDHKDWEGCTLTASPLLQAGIALPRGGGGPGLWLLQWEKRIKDVEALPRGSLRSDLMGVTRAIYWTRPWRRGEGLTEIGAQILLDPIPEQRSQPMALPIYRAELAASFSQCWKKPEGEKTP